MQFFCLHDKLSLMLKIRLQRIGKKNQAYFRLVVLEHTVKPKGRYLELLGSYDPHKNIINAKKDRIEYWISKGAKLSPTANNLLVDRNILAGKKVLAWKPKKKDQKNEPAPAKEKPKETEAQQTEEEKTEQKTEQKMEEKSAEESPTT